MGKCGCKKQEEKKQEELQEKQLEKCFENCNCASARDCTGTVVSAPLNEDQMENYQEKYHFRAKAPDELRKE